MDIQHMRRAPINGTELAFAVSGAGEPILFIHGGIYADAFGPLVVEPALRDRFRLITYHRRGYGASARPAGLATIPQQAADARALLRRLGISRAHIVGHSYGGTIALQLALDTPDVVQSLTVMEPAMIAVPSGEQLFQQTLGPAIQRYEAGDREGALDTFMRGVVDPNYRANIERNLPPGAWEEFVAGADTLFQVDLPALPQWQFTEAQAARITAPALSVVGSESGRVTPTLVEAHELMLAWLPNVEAYVLPGATHMLQMLNPRDLADALAAFCARSSVSVPA